MPTTNELKTIHAQLRAMNELGCDVAFKMQKKPSNPEPIIKIKYKEKQYNFSDPDYNVVIAQIAQLWKTIKRKEKSD